MLQMGLVRGTHVLLQKLDIREEAGDPVRQLPGSQVR